jgi:hypothetical protein
MGNSSKEDSAHLAPRVVKLALVETFAVPAFLKTWFSRITPANVQKDLFRKISVKSGVQQGQFSVMITSGVWIVMTKNA